MTAFRLLRTCGLWCVLVGFSAAALAQGPAKTSRRPAAEPSLRVRQELQQRARGMARELVTGVLDIQLRQLRENGLEELPVYREIAAMRNNIDALVDGPMREVVELLSSAHGAAPADARSIVAEARETTRDIVIRLSIEQQNLLRRLRISELANRVRRIIQLEEVVLAATLALPEQPAARQESRALAAAQDQRDVVVLFLKLVDALADVSTWSGPAGAGAADGLRILKAGQVGLEVDRTVERLESADFAGAATSERAVIKGLEALLEKLDEIQGLIAADNQEAQRLVRELIKRQEELKNQTAAGLNEQNAERLADEQTGLKRDLNKLDAALARLPAAAPLLEQAKAAALEAATKLFEAQQQPAIAEESKVLGNLAQIAEELAHAAGNSNSAKTADQLAQQVKDLSAAGEDLAKLHAAQKKINEAAPAKPEAAAAGEAKVADRLAHVDDGRDLPAAVGTRLGEAQDAVQAASEALAGAQPESAKQRLASAEAALERAVSETAAALADARRRQLAVAAGELARAAESLERAAAAERQVAESANAAGEQGLSKNQAEALGAEQERVGQVAEKVAAGIEHTAPAAAAMLGDAKKPIAAAAEALAGKQQTPALAHRAAEAAESAAEKLTEAAAAIRGQIGETGAELAQVAGQQLEPAATAREAVEKAQQQRGAAPAAAERLHALEAALAKTLEAAAAQASAAGRKEQAEAMQRAGAVAAARAAQAEADVQAQSLAAGRGRSPAEAAKAQQAVVETLAEVPAPSAGPLAEALRRAQTAAAEAARQTVAGNAAKASARRAEASQALEAAANAASEAAGAAAKAPAGPADLAAQEQVSALAREAAALAEPAVEPAHTLQRAAETANQASAQLRTQNTAGAAPAQQATADALALAQQQLQAAMDRLAGESAGHLAEAGKAASEIAQTTAPIDPAATTALRTAAEAAAAARPNQGATAVGAAEEAVERGFDRAQANLAAREQQITRDKVMGESLAALAQRQQSAREQIARQREHLEKHPAARTGGSPNAPATPAELAHAAQELHEATRDFAGAQRATGEAAVAVSRQDEVANVPIREALTIASSLDLPSLEAPAAMEAGGEVPASDAIGQGSTPVPRGEGPASRPDDGAAASAAELSSAELGSGFVPSSPEFTAGQIAGPKAMRQAQSLLAGRPPGTLTGKSQRQGAARMGRGAKGAPNRGQAQPADDESLAASAGGDETPEAAQPGAAHAQATRGGSSTSGAAAQNQRGANPPPFLQSGPTGAAGNRPGAGADTDSAERKLADEAWIAKLPPELRKAIRAKSQRAAPPAYEQRLRKYFEEAE